MSISAWSLRKQVCENLKICFYWAIFLLGEEWRVWGQRSVFISFPSGSHRSVTAKGCIWGRINALASFLELFCHWEGSPERALNAWPSFSPPFLRPQGSGVLHFPYLLLGTAVQTVIPAIWEAEAEGSQIRGQLWQFKS